MVYCDCVSKYRTNFVHDKDFILVSNPQPAKLLCGSTSYMYLIDSNETGEIFKIEVLYLHLQQLLGN